MGDAMSDLVPTPRHPRIDLNADVGEGDDAASVAGDARVLAHASSANVACGAHAGSPATMDAIVALCARHEIAVGAHPGYPDRAGFGRRAIDMPPAAIESSVRQQVEALARVCHAHGVPLRHVKAHGALYNQAATDPAIATAIARGVAAADPSLDLFGLATSAVVAEAADAAGLRFVPEAFADRRYRPDGSLEPRSEPDALLLDPAEAATQAVTIARDGVVIAADGSRVPIRAETICVHGDTPGAATIIAAVAAALRDAGIPIRGR